jgi:parallel beta-helix repeat protein
MVNNGIFIRGATLEHYNTHEIDTSNTVNDKSLYYWKNQVGGLVPPNAGQIILVNCTGVMVENQNIGTASAGIELDYCYDNTIANNTVASDYNNYGIVLSFSNRNTVTNNTVKDNYFGIYLWDSDYNTITYNAALLNHQYGIWLEEFSDGNSFMNNTILSNLDGMSLYLSNSNTIANNTLSNTDRGLILINANSNTIVNNDLSFHIGESILLDNSNSNTITENDLSNNAYGLYLYFTSNGNMIHHNNFISNAVQAYDEGTNTWNQNYPSGGNYWNHIPINDLFHGPQQDIPGGDGINDEPYLFDISGIDRYPFISPNGWINNPPYPPSIPSGPTKGIVNTLYLYMTTTVDPEGSLVYYMWDWGDQSPTTWIGPYLSGEIAPAPHAWTQAGNYLIKVKAKDTRDYESTWSEPLLVRMYKLGDINGDDIVDFGDINPFVLVLSTNETIYYQHYPQGYYYTADCNRDGHVDFGDINPFVAILSGGGG